MPVIGRISVGDGATFTPSVNSAGEISWTNNKNLPNPETVDLAQAVLDRGTFLPLSGGTMTGNLTINKSVPTITLKDTNIERGTAPASNYSNIEIVMYDKNYKRLWGLLHDYYTNGGNKVSLIAYNGQTTDFTNGGISVGYDGNGTLYATAPTPAKASNDTKIATTAFVKTNLADYLPLSGGTLTGKVNFSVNDAISRSVDSENLTITGGTTGGKGAQLILNGKDSSSAGTFNLQAHNGTTGTNLQGYAGGSLTWGGNAIALAKDVLSLNGNNTMTGGLKGDRTNNDFTITNMNADYGLLLYGYNQSENNGAILKLNSKEALSNAGNFYLKASDGTNKPALIGKPDGTLTWAGKEVERVNAIGSDYIRYESGLQICWGQKGSITTTNTTITFPVAFNSQPRIAITATADTVSTSNTDETSFNAKTSSGGATVAYIAVGYWK